MTTDGLPIIKGLSLDLSKARTGVCFWHDQTPVRTFHWEFGGKDTGELLAALRYRLTDSDAMGGADNVDWVAVEDVRPVNKHHSEIHFGMLGLIAEVCHRRDVPLIRATASQAKKALTGSGKADKEAMLAAAREKHPLANVSNHDQADALAVGLVAVELIDWSGNGVPDVKEAVIPF